ncbi:hypothetical protein BH23DEI1_BH23DEI1_00430 [soil metagenome]
MSVQPTAYVYPTVRVGSRVEAGQRLGVVCDLLGEVIQDAAAPASGTVPYYVSSLAIIADEPPVGVGT